MGICENAYLARAQSSNMADESLLRVFRSNNLTADTLPNTTWSNLRINTGKPLYTFDDIHLFFSFSEVDCISVNPGLDRLRQL
jgi:hypothetical protein